MTMGEANRRRAEEMTRKLSDEGRIIEAGWLGLRAMWLPPNCPPDQERDLRWAFMAGAQHLFGSIMTMLDPAEEPTEADLARMDKIDAELKAFAAEVTASLPTKGRA